MVKVSMEVRSGAARFDVGVQAESIQRAGSFVEHYYRLPSVTATLEHPRREAFPSHRTDSRLTRELFPELLGTDAHDGGTPPLVGCPRKQAAGPSGRHREERK
jgi:hypothetical protein